MEITDSSGTTQDLPSHKMLTRKSVPWSMTKTKNVPTPGGFHLSAPCPLPHSPQTSVLSGEYCKPAVMGQIAVSPGHRSNSPETIKEILLSAVTSDFQPPSREKLMIGSRLSPKSVVEDGEIKKWQNQKTHNDNKPQKGGTVIQIVMREDASSSNTSVDPPDELTAQTGHVVSNSLRKLIHTAQSTAARCISFNDGVPPTSNTRSEINQRHSQRIQSESCIKSESAERDPNKGTETIIYTSLLSDPSFSASRALERENTHLIVADMVIATLENVKCNILSEQSKLAEDYCLSRTPTPADHISSCIKKEMHSGSINSTDSGYECGSSTQLDDSFDSGTTTLYEDQQNEFDDLNFGPDGTWKAIERQRLSAEHLARRLFKSFRTMWMPPESEIHQFDTVEMVLDKFLPLKDTLPGAEESVDLTADFKLSSRLRGTEDWAPPRFQILFFLHPPQKREAVVAAQNSMCAGCGTPIELKYIKKLRYCEYLGKYFCECCHRNDESPIPSHILTKWDFSKYPVCNFSKQLLQSIWNDPLFNIYCINKALLSKVKELRKSVGIQEKLIHIKKLLSSCRLAESAMMEFQQVHPHLTRELYLYSLNDLTRMKCGLLVPGLKDILKTALAHVEDCQLCLGKGFICEFCKNKKVIFPFQTNQCKRCNTCKACFHKDCFKSEECPKCLRIQTRKELLLTFQQPMD
eukprot:gi/632949072/ref/XP_007889945.1/ PREDICTED: uncharacterized protein KIAA0226-like homolog isoform X2 [Callorhinchus milii]